MPDPEFDDLIRGLEYSGRQTIRQGHAFPTFPVKENKIVLWVSLAPPHLDAEEFALEEISRIPALLDTGFNQNFSLTEHYFRKTGCDRHRFEWGASRSVKGIGGKIL